MKRIFLLLSLTIFCGQLFAQLEVKPKSFKQEEGFVNTNEEKMFDDNGKPYAVLKIRTENINDRQRRELQFQSDANTYIVKEQHVGEVWLYITYDASYIKISHSDFSSMEFRFPFDMRPKYGYEMVLVNNAKSSIDDTQVSELKESLETTTEVINKAADRVKASESFSFLTLNASYNNYGKTAYGLTIGSMKKMGWFVNLMTNFNFKGFATEYECGNDFLVNGNYPFYTGKEAYTSLSALGGVIFRIAKPVGLRIGAGYGMRAMSYEMTDGKYVKNTDVSTQGLELAVGAQFNIGKVLISIEAASTNFKYYEAKIGIGMGY